MKSCSAGVQTVDEVYSLLRSSYCVMARPICSSSDCHVLPHGKTELYDFLVVLIQQLQKTGKPIRLLESGLSHDYRTTSVVLTGAPNVHKSSHRATLCLTDLVRLVKQVRRHAASVPKRQSGLTKVFRKTGTHARQHSPQTRGSVAFVLNSRKSSIAESTPRGSHVSHFIAGW